MKYSGLCQLADDLSRRVIEFGGEHPLANENDYKGSVQFQDEATGLQIQGVFRIGGVKRDRDLNFFYPLSGFEADLHQLARRKELKDPKLPLILLQTVEVLLSVREKFQRTHGALALESILVRDPAAKKLEIVLTDFLPKPRPGTPPDKYEKDDLRALGQIIAAAAIINRDQDAFDSRQLYGPSLPPPDDQEATNRFGNRWSVLQMLADDLLSPGGPQVNSTLEHIQEQLQRLVGVTPAVRKRPQTISFAPLPDKRVGEAPFQIAASANSGLPVSLSIVSGQSFASVRGRTVTLLGAGKVSLKATQPGNEEFQPAEEVVREFNISKSAQTIEFAPLPDRALNAPPFDLIARASSGLPISFTVVSGRADIQGTRVTLRGVGAIEIKARQEGNPNYEPAESVRSLRVTGRSQTIRLERPADKFLGDPPFALNASASSGLEVNFRIAAGPARVTGNRITLDGTGTVTVAALQPGNDEYSAAAEATCSFEVKERERARKPQTITFTPVGTRAYGDRPFRLFARSDAGLPVSFSIESGPAQVTGDELKLTGAGQIVLRATQSGNADYAPAEATQTFLVAKARQTISFGPLPRDLAVGNSVSLQATTSSGLPVRFAVASGKGELTGNQLTLTAAGTISLKASQSGDQNYEPAEAVQTATVARGKQTITFEPLPGETRFGETITLGARASSGLPVTLAVVSGPATVAGNQLTPQGTGEVKIRATQAGDANYNAAAELLQTLNISKATQTVRFDQWPRELKVDESCTLGASASSGLPVSFNLLSGPASLADNRLTATAAGRVQIEAIQSGNENYQPATNTQSVKVAKRTQEIHFDELLDRKLNEPVFALSATANSKLPVTFNVVSGPAKIHGNQVTLTGRGLVEIEASQQGNAMYEPASTVTRGFTVIDLQRKRRMVLAALCAGFVTGAVGVGIWWSFRPKDPTIGGLENLVLEERQPTTNMLTLKVDPRSEGDTRVVATPENGEVLEVLPRGTNEQWELVLTPKKEGKTVVNVAATDRRQRHTQKSFEVTVHAPPLPPEVSGISDVALEVDQLTNVVVEIKADGRLSGSLAITAKPYQEGIVAVSPSVSGDKWALALRGASEGQTRIVVTANARSGMSRPVSFEAKVSSPPPLPRIVAVEDQILEKDEPTKALELKLNSRVHENVQLKAEAEETNIVDVSTDFTGESWHLSMTPRSEGATRVTISATDSRARKCKPISFKVTVTAPPPAPEIATIQDQTLEAGQSVTNLGLNLKIDPRLLGRLQITAESENAGVVEVSAHGLGQNWGLALTPRSLGKTKVKVGATVSRKSVCTPVTFGVIVVKAPDRPQITTRIPDQTLEEGAPPAVIALDLSVDPKVRGNLQVNGKAETNGVVVISAEGSGEKWGLTLKPVLAGKTSVEITATDLRGRISDPVRFSVTVQPAPGPPVISAIQGVSMEQGQSPLSLTPILTVDPRVQKDTRVTVSPDDSRVIKTSATGSGTNWVLTISPLSRGRSQVTVEVIDQRNQKAKTAFTVFVDYNREKLGAFESLAVRFGKLSKNEVRTAAGKSATPVGGEGITKVERDEDIKLLERLKADFGGQSPYPKVSFKDLNNSIENSFR